MKENLKVHKDYKDNILVDKDSPILAMKANRDRYTDSSPKMEKYLGLPQVGSIYSEDALTWNVFRTLEFNKSFSVLEPVLGELKNPRTLYWTYAASPEAADLQFIVGDAIRQIDGRFGRQITEPDIIIATDDRFILIEAKLGRPNVAPSHLWAGSVDGPALRASYYFIKNPHPFVAKHDEKLYAGACYQLYRMAFYCHLVGSKLKLHPELVSLANEKTWTMHKPSHGSAQDSWGLFQKEIAPGKLDIRACFWQQIRTCIQQNKKPGLAPLRERLENHICL